MAAPAAYAHPAGKPEAVNGGLSAETANSGGGRLIGCERGASRALKVDMTCAPTRK